MNKTSKTKLFISNIGWIYVAKIATQLLSALSIVLVLNKLSVDIWGTYSFLIGLFLVIHIFNISPLLNLINRFIPEFNSNNEIKKIKKLSKFSYLFLLATLSISFILIYLGRELISNFFNIPHFRQYFWVFIIYALFNALKNISYAIGTSLLLNKQITRVQIINASLRFLAYILLLDYLDPKLLIIIEASLGLIFFLQIWFINHSFILQTTYNTTQKSAGMGTSKKRILRYGYFSMFNELGAGIIGKSSDYYIIAAISSPYYIGLYSFAYTVYDMIYKVLPLKEFLTVLRPLYFQKFGQEAKSDVFYNFYNFLVKVMIPVFTFPAIIFFLYGFNFIDIIFNGKYNNAFAVTSIVLATNVVLAIFYPVGITLQLKEKMDILFYSKIIVVFSIAAGILGMKFFGIVGVAVATGLGEILKHIFILFLVRKEKIIIYKFREFKNYLIVFLVPGFLFYFINQIIPSNMYYLSTSLVFFTGLSFYLLIRYHPFNTQDLLLLKNVRDNNIIFRKSASLIKKLSKDRLAKYV